MKKQVDILSPSATRCVCCGREIPEGYGNVCAQCMARTVDPVPRPDPPSYDIVVRKEPTGRWSLRLDGRLISSDYSTAAQALKEVRSRFPRKR